MRLDAPLKATRVDELGLGGVEVVRAVEFDGFGAEVFAGSTGHPAGPQGAVSFRGSSWIEGPARGLFPGLRHRPRRDQGGAEWLGPAQSVWAASEDLTGATRRVAPLVAIGWSP